MGISDWSSDVCSSDLCIVSGKQVREVILSWVPNKGKVARLAAALWIVPSAAAAAAEGLVVRASGPSAKSYPAGRKLADDARITLQANDSLVLLDNRGTRTLRGPGIFTPSGPAQANSRSALASVATGSTRRRSGELTSGLPSLRRKAYLCFCLKTKNNPPYSFTSSS